MALRIWKETVHIPTYGVGDRDRNPMFLEKRVYQGSSGRVYPWPVIDRIEQEKRDKAYQMVFLENDFIQVQVMPELGGKIYRAVDKTNGYDFVYWNQVIKPALVDSPVPGLRRHRVQLAPASSPEHLWSGLLRARRQGSEQENRMAP